MIAKKSCVDETILIKNLIRNNLEMFSNESNENYDGLFGKMLENLLISYGEARDNVY